MTDRAATTTKRTPVKRPVWGVSSMDIPADAVIEVGPKRDLRKGIARSLRGTAPMLGRRTVYLNGEPIGDVVQHQRRGERPTHRGSRIVIVTGWPVQWSPRTLDLRISFDARSYDLMGQAAYALVEQVLEQQRGDAARVKEEDR